MWERILRRAGIGIQSGRRFVAGLILLAFFLVAFAGALFLLAALQLQHELTTANAQGTPFSIARVREAIGDLDRADVTQKNYADAAAKIAIQKSDLEKIEDDAIAQMTQADRSVAEAIRQQSAPLPPALVIYHMPPTLEDTKQPGYYTLNERYAFYTKMILSMAGKAPGFDVRSYVEKLNDAVRPILARFSAAQMKYDTASNQHNELDQQLKTYAQTPSPPPVTNPKERLLVDDFRAYEWVAGPAAFRIVLMPNSMLVLFLAICMGILGSLIYLARQMVRDNCISNAPEMLFRIGLGAAVALALYLFAAAGMVAFSQGASAQTQNDMTPT